MSREDIGAIGAVAPAGTVSAAPDSLTHSYIKSRHRAGAPARSRRSCPLSHFHGLNGFLCVCRFGL